MVVFFLLSGFLLSGFLPVCFLLSGFLLFFLSTVSLSSLQTTTFFTITDTSSVLLVTMAVFVLYQSYLASKSFRVSLNLAFYGLLVSSVVVFSTSRALTLFIFYEISIFPILFIVLKWGSYPERSLSAILLLVYTLVCTLPFIFVLAYLHLTLHTFSLRYLRIFPPLRTNLLWLICFLAFAVKLPVYGLHFWLPIAHVEAPTFGSIILAGILLKLGGVGLLRLLPLFDLGEFRYVFASYSMVFLLFSTLVCTTQSDFKRLVAFSSVSHMIALVPLVSLGSESAIATSTLLMLFHGVSSPLLFFLVGVAYELAGTRQLLVLRGFVTLSPLLSFFFTLAFFFNLSAPPLPSFISEVLFFTLSLTFSFYFLPFLLLFAFLSLVYNLSWFSTRLFNSPLPSPHSSPLSFKSFSILRAHVLCASSYTLLVLRFAGF